MRNAVSATAFLLTAIAVAAGGQSIVVIPDRVVCADCAIEIERGTDVLLDPDGTTRDPPEAVVVDSAGHFWVLTNGQLPLVFGGDGKPLATIGQKGKGVGEFTLPVAILPIAGDSVVI